MLIHDVSLEGAHVVLGIDRAGLVGADGETHHGVFDVGYLCSIPGMKVLCPASFAELREMLRMALYDFTGPVAVRYPRGGEGTYRDCAVTPSVIHTQGDDLTVVCYGTLVNDVLEAAKQLETMGIACEIIRLTRLDLLDLETVFRSLRKTKRLLVPEEAAEAGGVGVRILAACAGAGISLDGVKLLNLRNGIVPAGAVEELKALYALDGSGIAYGGLSLLNRL